MPLCLEAGEKKGFSGSHNVVIERGVGGGGGGQQIWNGADYLVR